MQIALELFREGHRIGLRCGQITAWADTAPEALRKFAGQLEQVSVEERAALLPGIELEAAAGESHASAFSNSAE